MIDVQSSSAIRTEQPAAQVLELLAHKPTWLSAVLERERVLQALTTHVPELASGALRITGCSDPRLAFVGL